MAKNTNVSLRLLICFLALLLISGCRSSKINSEINTLNNKSTSEYHINQVKLSLSSFNTTGCGEIDTSSLDMCKLIQDNVRSLHCLTQRDQQGNVVAGFVDLIEAFSSNDQFMCYDFLDLLSLINDPALFEASIELLKYDFQPNAGNEEQLYYPINFYVYQLCIEPRIESISGMSPMEYYNPLRYGPNNIRKADAKEFYTEFKKLWMLNKIKLKEN